MDFTVRYLEEAIARINADKENQIVAVKERVNYEVQPKYEEIEQRKNEAISKLMSDFNSTKSFYAEEYNNKVTALQARFESDRQIVCENAEKTKKEILTATLNTEIYPIQMKAEKAIKEINALIEKRTDKE